jgi:hypothetical protein
MVVALDRTSVDPPDFLASMAGITEMPSRTLSPRFDVRPGTVPLHALADPADAWRELSAEIPDYGAPPTEAAK